MKYVHLEQLQSIRDDYIAARLSLEYVEQAWEQLQGEPFTSGLRLRQIKQSLARLEGTYIVKLFAEFEGILRGYLTAARPGRRLRRTRVELVINSVALRLRVPDAIRDRVHLVRTYRNALTHPTDEEAEVVSFQQAVSYLNHFLVWLPPPP